MGKRKRHGARRQLLSLFLIPAVCLGAVRVTARFQGSFLPGLRQAAAASVLTNQPEGSLALLERRLTDRLNAPAFLPEEQPKDREPLVSPPKDPPAEPLEEPDVSEKDNLLPEVEDTFTAEQPLSRPEAIPLQYQGPIIEETFLARPTEGIIAYENGLIRNSTNLTDQEVQEILSQPDSLSLPSDGPQVLIYHTHATESFEPWDRDIYDTRNTWRSTNNAENMVAVGDEIAAALEKWGIEVVHDTTQHDYPSYNGSYERSEETIASYLEKYPTIRVALDVHRDAIQRENTLVKPIATVQQQKAARLMIIAGCDDGTMEMPDWRENLRFAAGLQSEIETKYPGLTRPVFFCYRRYNMHMTKGSLLIEFGSHGNTLEEVKRTGRMAGDAIGQYLSRRIS